MECKHSADFFMKYMDQTLSKPEAVSLRKHLDNCPKCQEEFWTYECIMDEFATMDEVSPFEGFEACVMDKIRALPAITPKSTNSIETLACTVGGIFSVLLGIGFILGMNKDAVMAYLSDITAFDNYMSLLESVSSYVELFAANLNVLIVATIGQVSTFVGAFRYVVLAVVVVLSFAYYYIYKRNKVEV